MNHRVKRIVTALAVAGGTALMSGAPASAQVRSVADILPPYEATAIVRDAGMQPISRPVWRPGRYVLLARDRFGRTLRVSVDARMGEVIRAVPVDTYADVGPGGYYEPRPRAYGYPHDPYLAARPVPPGNVPYEGSREFEYDDGDMPPPDAAPRVIPGPRSDAPSSSKSATLSPKPDVKKTPPLPRARPSGVASVTATAPAETKAPETTSSITAGTKNSPASEASASAAPKKDIRIIDMSKPKPAETPDAKTASAEPKVAPVETKPAETKTESSSAAKPLEDPAAKPRF